MVLRVETVYLDRRVESERKLTEQLLEVTVNGLAARTSTFFVKIGDIKKKTSDMKT